MERIHPEEKWPQPEEHLLAKREITHRTMSVLDSALIIPMPTTTSKSPAAQPGGTLFAGCIFLLVFGSAAFTHLLKCCEITEVLKEGNVFVGMKCAWQCRADLGSGDPLLFPLRCC